MNTCLAISANVATIVLAVAAIFAGYLAYRNISILKEQRRIDTFLKLIDQMANQRERDNRAWVYSSWEGEHPIENIMDKALPQRIAFIIDHARYLEKEQRPTGSSKKIIRQKEAIEETISCLDRVGFFLLGSPPKVKVDSRLKNEAPDWIWTIADDMWKELGDYVEGVQSGSLQRKINKEAKANPNYGRYFKALNEEAQKHLPKSDNDNTKQ